MGLNESARSTVIELMTRKDPLKAYEVTLLQSGLRQIGELPANAKLDGSFKDQTAEAAANFLLKPENQYYVRFASDQVRGAIQTYSENVAQKVQAGHSGLDTVLETFGFKDKPAAPRNVYNEIFGNQPERLENFPRAASVDALLRQPMAFKGDDIRMLEQQLKLPQDGLFGRSEGIQVARHLQQHPADFATIGTPILNLMMSSTDNRELLQQVTKPQEYYDRVSQLIADTRGVSGTSGATYELQVLLNAGGYYRTNKNEPSFGIADGGPGPQLDEAIRVFNREKPQKRAELDSPETGTKVADNSTGGGPDTKAPDVAETVASVAKPAPFKPFA